ncbi:MAG: hypothetical protein R3257_03700, partial [bacterium]|nr:hypothetical protein [bacterium]
VPAEYPDHPIESVLRAPVMIDGVARYVDLAGAVYDSKTGGKLVDHAKSDNVFVLVHEFNPEGLKTSSFPAVPQPAGSPRPTPPEAPQSKGRTEAKEHAMERISETEATTTAMVNLTPDKVLPLKEKLGEDEPAFGALYHNENQGWVVKLVKQGHQIEVASEFEKPDGSMGEGVHVLVEKGVAVELLPGRHTIKVGNQVYQVITTAQGENAMFVARDVDQAYASQEAIPLGDKRLPMEPIPLSPERKKSPPPPPPEKKPPSASPVPPPPRRPSPPPRRPSPPVGIQGTGVLPPPNPPPRGRATQPQGRPKPPPPPRKGPKKGPPPLPTGPLPEGRAKVKLVRPPSPPQKPQATDRTAVLPETPQEIPALAPPPVHLPVGYNNPPKATMLKPKGENSQPFIRLFWGNAKRIVFGKGAKNEIGLVAESHESHRLHFEKGFWGRRTEQVKIHRPDLTKQELVLTVMGKDPVHVQVTEVSGERKKLRVEKGETVVLHEGDGFLIGEGAADGPYKPVQITFKPE